jgi:hypothetical protein
MTFFMNIHLVKLSPYGHEVYGKWIKDGETETLFMGDVQQPSGKQLKSLLEGARSSELISVYAPVTLDFTTADVHTGKKADVILYDSKRYRIISARKWQNKALPALTHHWELIAERETE